MITHLNTVARLFAAGPFPPEASNSATLGATADGEITIERASRLLGVSRDQAIQALVSLRTFVHNASVRWCIKAGSTATTNSFATDAALTIEAAAMLAASIDKIDEVFVQLDARVAEGVLEGVALENHSERDARLLGAVATLTAHEAAWLAFRPDSRPAGPAWTGERGMTQLELALAPGPNRRPMATKRRLRRPCRLDRHETHRASSIQRAGPQATAPSMKKVAWTKLVNAGEHGERPSQARLASSNLAELRHDVAYRHVGALMERQ